MGWTAFKRAARGYADFKGRHLNFGLFNFGY